jgi:hypothetical protein
MKKRAGAPQKKEKKARKRKSAEESQNKQATIKRAADTRIDQSEINPFSFLHRMRK